jgi:hypothetical protein
VEGNLQPHVPKVLLPGKESLGQPLDRRVGGYSACLKVKTTAGYRTLVAHPTASHCTELSQIIIVIIINNNNNKIIGMKLDFFSFYRNYDFTLQYETYKTIIKYQHSTTKYQ